MMLTGIFRGYCWNIIPFGTSYYTQVVAEKELMVAEDRIIPLPPSENLSSTICSPVLLSKTHHSSKALTQAVH